MKFPPPFALCVTLESVKPSIDQLNDVVLQLT
jgi:hypothetical protein